MAVLTGTGDADDELSIFINATGKLAHELPITPTGFESEIDFDSGTVGIQEIDVDAGSSIVVVDGGGKYAFGTATFTDNLQASIQVTTGAVNVTLDVRALTGGLIFDASASTQLDATIRANGSTTSLTGGVGNDSFTLSGSGNAGELSLLGGVGDDSFTIDISDGDPIPAAPDSVTFDGGDDTDTVAVINGTNAEITYLPTGANSAEIRVFGGNKAEIANTESTIVDTPSDDLQSLIIDLFATTDGKVTLADDAIANDGVSQATFTSFLTLSFRNPRPSLTPQPSLQIDSALDVTIDPMDSTFNADVTVHLGDGVSAVLVNATTGSSNFYRFLGLDSKSSGDEMTLRVADSSRPIRVDLQQGDDTLRIAGYASTASPVAITVNAGDGDDSITVSRSSIAPNLGTIAITGQEGSDTLTLDFASISPANLGGAINFTGGDGKADTIALAGLPSGFPTEIGIDAMAIASYGLSLGDGTTTNTVAILTEVEAAEFAAIPVSVVVLSISDPDNGHEISVGEATEGSRTGNLAEFDNGAFTLYFDNPSTRLSLSGGDKADLFTINAFDSAFDGAVDLSVGAGGDSVTIHATTGTTNLYRVIGRDDELDADDITLDVTASSRPIEVDLLKGNDILAILGFLTTASVPITVNGGEGNDSFTLAQRSSPANAGALQIQGGPGNDTLNVILANGVPFSSTATLGFDGGPDANILTFSQPPANSVYTVSLTSDGTFGLSENGTSISDGLDAQNVQTFDVTGLNLTDATAIIADGSDGSLRAERDGKTSNRVTFGTNIALLLANPTVSLTLNGGDKYDTIQLDPLAPGFAADVSIFGKMGNDTITVSGFQTDVTIAGDEGNDAIRVGRSAAINTGTLAANGNLGTDTFTLDLDGGDPVPALPGGISFNGGDDLDTALIVNGSVVEILYTPTADGQAEFRVFGGAAAVVSNLESARIEIASDDLETLTIDAIGGSVNLADDATPGDDFSQATLAFSPILTFRSPRLATVSSQVGLQVDDARDVTINALDSAFNANVAIQLAAGVTTATILATTGTSNEYRILGIDGVVGDDLTLDVTQYSRPITVDLQAGDDTLTIVAFHAAPLSSEILTINAGAGDDSITLSRVSASPNSGLMRVNGQAGADAIVLDLIQGNPLTEGEPILPSPGPSVVFDGGGEADRVLVSGGILLDATYMATEAGAGRLRLRDSLSVGTLGFTSVDDSMVAGSLVPGIDLAPDALSQLTISIEAVDEDLYTTAIDGKTGRTDVALSGGLASVASVSPTESFVFLGSSRADALFARFDADFAADVTLDTLTGSDAVRVLSVPSFANLPVPSSPLFELILGAGDDSAAIDLNSFGLDPLAYRVFGGVGGVTTPVAGEFNTLSLIASLFGEDADVVSRANLDAGDAPLRQQGTVAFDGRTLSGFAITNVRARAFTVTNGGDFTSPELVPSDPDSGYVFGSLRESLTNAQFNRTITRLNGTTSTLSGPVPMVEFEGPQTVSVVAPLPEINRPITLGNSPIDQVNTIAGAGQLSGGKVDGGLRLVGPDPDDATSTGSAGFTIRNLIVSNFRNEAILAEVAGDLVSTLLNVQANASGIGIHLRDSSRISALKSSVNANDTDGVRITRGSLNSLSAIVASANGASGVAILDSTGNLVVDADAIANGGNGVTVRGGSFNSLSGIESSSNVGNGVTVENSPGTSLIDALISANGANGVDLANVGTGSNLVRNATISGHGGGIGLSASGSGGASFVLDSIAISGSQLQGVRVAGSSGSSLVNITSRANLGDGLTLASATRATVTNLVSEDNAGAGLNLLGPPRSGVPITDPALVANSQIVIESARVTNNRAGITLGAIHGVQLVSPLVSRSATQGIALDSANAVTITNPTVSGSGLDGVRVTSSSDAVITGGRIETSGGSGLVLLGSATTRAVVTGTTIATSGGHGLTLESGANGLAISDAAISGSGLNGVNLVGVTNVLIQGGLLLGNGGNGVFAAASQSIVIKPSALVTTISGNKGNGVLLGDGTTGVQISGARVTDNALAGVAIATTAPGSSIADLTLSGLTITGHGGAGVTASAAPVTSIRNLAILDSQITNNGAGVVLAGVANASIVRGVISGNRGDGLRASGGSGLSVNGSAIVDNLGNGLTLAQVAGASISGASVGRNSGVGISASGGSNLTIADTGVGVIGLGDALLAAGNTGDGVTLVDVVVASILRSSILANGSVGIRATGVTGLQIRSSGVGVHRLSEGIYAANSPGNGLDGIQIVGITGAVINGNAIGRNGRTGIYVQDGSFNTIEANFIGVTPNGRSKASNNGDGVYIDRSARNLVTRNTIVGNAVEPAGGSNRFESVYREALKKIPGGYRFYANGVHLSGRQAKANKVVNNTFAVKSGRRTFLLNEGYAILLDTGASSPTSNRNRFGKNVPVSQRNDPFTLVRVNTDPQLRAVRNALRGLDEPRVTPEVGASVASASVPRGPLPMSARRAK